MNDKTGGPAFPSEGEGFGNPKHSAPGMTLRDYFAAQALKGMLSCEKFYREVINHSESREMCAAHWSYAQANAMLTERGKK